MNVEYVDCVMTNNGEKHIYLEDGKIESDAIEQTGSNLEKGGLSHRTLAKQRGNELASQAIKDALQEIQNTNNVKAHTHHEIDVGDVQTVHSMHKQLHR